MWHNVQIIRDGPDGIGVSPTKTSFYSSGADLGILVGGVILRKVSLHITATLFATPILSLFATSLLQISLSTVSPVHALTVFECHSSQTAQSCKSCSVDCLGY